MQAWNSLSLPQEMNCSSELTSDCLLNPYFDKHGDHFTHFQSDLSSVVSSPAALTSSILNKAIGVREFGNLGPVCSSGGNPSLYSSGTGLATARSFHGSGFSISKEFVEGNLPNFANSLALNLPLTTLSNDLEFTERINSIGNRNNCTLRRSHSAVNDTEFPHSAADMMTFWGSPSLQQGGSQTKIQKLNELSPIPPNSISNESSSISEQVPSGVTVSQTSNEMNSAKRRAVSKTKAIKHVSPKAVNSQQPVEEDDALKGKRRKTAETNSSRKGGINREETTVKSDDDPPKDYIHVRARRGQATDNHSLAERVRREKIGERMKLLQDLVPGCNKVTGKALMLDEIINYVQSLQRQVEFLSMKLASVDPRKEVTSKAIIHQNAPLPDSLYTKDFNISSSFDGHHHQPKQSASMNTTASLSQCIMDPVYKPSYHNLESQLPQFPSFGEDDLHSIVRMGLGQNSNKKQHLNQ